jgi:hypothetical protein
MDNRHLKMNVVISKTITEEKRCPLAKFSLIHDIIFKTRFLNMKIITHNKTSKGKPVS